MFKYTDTKNFNFSYIKEKRIFQRKETTRREGGKANENTQKRKHFDKSHSILHEG